MPFKDQELSAFSNTITLSTGAGTIGTIATSLPLTNITYDDVDQFNFNHADSSWTATVDTIEKSDIGLKAKCTMKKKKDEPKYPSKPVEYTPIKILRNGPATIVFWGGPKHEKTVVKCPEGKEYDLYEAFTAAFAIRLFGNNNHLKKTIAKLFKEEKA